MALIWFAGARRRFAGPPEVMMRKASGASDAD
jgi:hypothetical protein